MLMRALRQYRRFLLGCGLLTLFIAAALVSGTVEWPADVPLNGFFIAAWVITLVLVVGVPTLVLALLIPSLLALIELFLLTLILAALADPLLRAALGAVYAPWIACASLLVIFILLERSIYGHWFSHIWRRDMQTRSAEFTVGRSASAVWSAVFPDPASAGAFYWPEASFLPPAGPSDAHTVISLPRRGGFKDTLAEVIIEAAEPWRYLRYRTRPLPGSSDPAQLIEVRITPLDTGAQSGAADSKLQVRYTEQCLDVPFGQRLSFYLNNGFRDTVASLRARLNGRKDRSLQGLQMLRR